MTMRSEFLSWPFTELRPPTLNPRLHNLSRRNHVQDCSQVSQNSGAEAHVASVPFGRTQSGVQGAVVLFKQETKRCVLLLIFGDADKENSIHIFGTTHGVSACYPVKLHLALRDMSSLNTASRAHAKSSNCSI